MYRVLPLILMFALLGCETGPVLLPVKGTVKFDDGSSPQGEVCDVRFEPSGNNPKTKMARGEIKADGSFQLMTMEPADGAYAGEYKVVVEIYETYIGRESLVHPDFERIATTPLKATVEKGGKNEFQFVVKRRPESQF